MDDLKRKNLKRFAFLIPLAVIIGVFAFILRGPQVSDALKGLILPEIEQMIGRKVTAQKIYVNLFPLFVEARDLKVFDEKGEHILLVQRTKAYLDLTGIAGRQIKIRRLVLKEPQIKTDRKQAVDIAAHVKNYLEKVSETAFKVKIKAVQVQNGGLHYSDDKFSAASLVEGFNGEVILGEWEHVNASLRRFGFKKEGWPDLSGSADFDLAVKDDIVKVKKFVVGSFGSKITGAGEYAGGKADFKTDIALFMDTVKKIFGLRRSGAGEVRAGGYVKYIDKLITLDLKVEGKFYLQTLMELLGVKERIEGLMEVKGSLNGPVNNIKGKGAAVLTDGNLFDVEVKLLKCAVSYADGLMRFTDGSGRLYNGDAKLSASINLPVVNSFMVNVAFSNVDSRPLFKLIGWDPGVPAGKVNGTLLTSGADFNPEGSFEYRSIEKGKDVFGRVRDISGSYRMTGQLLTLGGLKLSTGISKAQGGGTVNIGEKSLDIDFGLQSADITDLTTPYYSKLTGTGAFRGKITGTFDNPVLGGRIDIEKPVFEKYAADTINADLTYRKDALTIREMSVKGTAQAATLKGRVAFRDAKELFDLEKPEYHLTASVENADLEKFTKIFYPDFKGSGRLNSSVEIGGTASLPDISGSASADRATVFNVAFDKADFRWTYKDERLSFTKMRITRGQSALTGEASIDTKGNFSYSSSSDKILLSDIVRREIKGDAVFALKSEGHGTFEDPSIRLDARMVEGRLKGKSVGSGTVSASIKGRDIVVRAGMFDDRVLLSANGRFEKEMPWSATIDIQGGRYDFIISSFLKDIPEDLILSMNGRALLSGDRGHIEGNLTLDKLALSMYGYSFANEKQIRLDIKDRLLSLGKTVMRSGNASLGIDGNVVLGKKYNLNMEGSSSLAPLKGLSARVGVLRGDAEFVLTVTGDWDSPEINGSVNLSNGSLSLKDYSYRLSALSGYMYMDSDRIVLQKLSGKLGGGDIDISGVLYLKKFSLKRFYVEAALSNITVSPSSEFNVNFGGNLLYKGTPDSRIVSGDLEINRARYKERVDWKSWLLKTKTTPKFKSEISGLEQTALNIRVVGKDNIFIDNNVARATVTADMVLRGWIYRPLLFGRMETTEGTVYFRNNEFRILHASVGFFDPNRINPVVDIASETTVKGYRIRMNLEGQIDHFNVALSSDPVLKEMDILSLLTVGQTSTEMKGMEGGIGAGEATSFVTGKIQDVVEERVRTITGLDRMQIDPHVSKKTGTVEPGVTVSKRLLGDKVFVTYTTPVNVSSSGEQIIKLEYVLSKRVSLVGIRDERGITGADVHFRFEFK